MAGERAAGHTRPHLHHHAPILNHEVVYLHETGAPGQLTAALRPDPVPGPGEALVEQHAIGVNFLDVLQRRGSSPLPGLPAILGGEGAGVVLGLGEGVANLKVGDRVAYIGGLGAYARRRTFAADRLVRLPAHIGFDDAAAVLLKGLTAHYLLRRLCRLEPGDPVLLHAAAGGVGLLFCQWARRLGLVTIGTVSTPEKAALARANGCDHVVVGYDRDKVLGTVREVTGGRGVALACDSVGLATMDISIAATRKRGTVASFGSASGAPRPISLGDYFGRALMFTMPNVAAFNEGDDLARNARELFDVIGQGLAVHIHARVPLADAARAHELMEGRASAGSIVLV